MTASQAGLAVRSVSPTLARSTDETRMYRAMTLIAIPRAPRTRVFGLTDIRSSRPVSPGDVRRVSAIAGLASRWSR